MTDPDATTRRAKIAEAITAHRKGGSQSPVLFVAGEPADDADPAERPFVDYEDRQITVDVSDAERERLDELMSEFSVFKIAQPATRKAPDSVVCVSAIADAKHAADFVDRIFLDVFETGPSYDLFVED